MYLIVTKSFPPELGGMQNLMWGLSKELSKNFMIKVFADYIEAVSYTHLTLPTKQAV